MLSGVATDGDATLIECLSACLKASRVDKSYGLDINGLNVKDLLENLDIHLPIIGKFLFSLVVELDFWVFLIEIQFR